MSIPPDGFSPLVFKSPFTQTVRADFLEARRNGRRVFGVRIEDQHCNSAGYVHGGFLLAVADFTLSHGTYEDGDLPPRITLHLNADFMRPAAAGDWLEIEVDVKKSSASLAFADCLMRVSGRLVMRAAGVFRPVRAAG